MRSMSQAGFTLMELLVAMSMAGMLTAFTLTNYGPSVEKRRLLGAAETLVSQFQLARLESVKRSSTVRFDFSMNNTTTWSYGFTDDVDGTNGCTPTITNKATAGACTIEYDNDISVDFDGDGNNTDPVLYRISSDDFPQITMKGNAGNSASFSGRTYSTFNPARGTAVAGTVVLLGKLFALEVRLSTLGRARICYPVGKEQIGGYALCD